MNNDIYKLERACFNSEELFETTGDTTLGYKDIEPIRNVIAALKKYRNMYRKEYTHHMDYKRRLDRAEAINQELTNEHLAECELLPMNLETRHFCGRGWGKDLARSNEFFKYLLTLPEKELRGIEVIHKHVAVTKDKVVPESYIEQVINVKINNLKDDHMGELLAYEFKKLKEELLKYNKK